MQTAQTNLGSAQLILGVVTELHLNAAGIPVLRVQDAGGGSYYPCFLGSMLAGADGRFSINAPNIGSRVIVLINPQPNARNYFVVGGIMHPDDQMAISVDGLPSALELDKRGFVAEERGDYYVNQDYKLTHITDTHIQNLNSFINLSDLHGLTLQGSPRVSVQLPEDEEVSVFRVSAGGLALNTVLSAEPFLNRLFDYLAELKTKIDALEAAINVINPALINALNSAAVLASTPLPPPDTPINPGLSAALLDQGVQVSNAATELASTPQPQEAQSVRSASENDKNPYILIP